jgi:branched-chain amino acid transport system permease protein
MHCEILAAIYVRCLVDALRKCLVKIILTCCYIFVVFLIAGALAGAAGIMLGLKYNVYPSMGNIGLKAFIASVFGGLGSVRGAIVGAVIIGLIEVFVSGYIDSGLRDLITFTLLIAVLLIKPTGLMGVDIEEKA